MRLMPNNTRANTSGGSSRLSQDSGLLSDVGQSPQVRRIRSTVAAVHRPQTINQSVTKFGLRAPGDEVPRLAAVRRCIAAAVPPAAAVSGPTFAAGAADVRSSSVMHRM